VGLALGVWGGVQQRFGIVRSASAVAARMTG
jgi:hypothetical protein